MTSIRSEGWHCKGQKRGRNLFLNTSQDVIPFWRQKWKWVDSKMNWFYENLRIIFWKHRFLKIRMLLDNFFWPIMKGFFSCPALKYYFENIPLSSLIEILCTYLEKIFDIFIFFYVFQHVSTFCHMLQHVATCCNMLQHVAKCWNMLKHIEKYENVKNLFQVCT